MKRIIAIALLGAVFSFPSAQAQLAKQKGITIEELNMHVSALVKKGDDVSKAELKQEADVMAKSKKESFVGLAVRAYTVIGDTEKAEEVSKGMLKRFPKGSRARGLAYREIFLDETLPAAEVEQQYQQWLKEYPEKNFEEDDRMAYSHAARVMAVRYAKENNIEKANVYLAAVSDPRTHIYAVSDVGGAFIKQDEYSAALPLLEAENRKLQTARESDVPEVRNLARYGNEIPSLLGEVYLSVGQVDKGVEVLKKSYKRNPTPKDARMLAEGLTKQGQELDAFLLLQEYMVKNGKREDFVEVMSPIYTKLNDNKGDFESYLASIEKQANEALVAKYKAEMIKEEAPAFSLVNRDGETVSLADMKGKVVVLDFWATWCGPCVMSFPGMQTAVNQYEDDPDVEFLFIDTWEPEKNYKELVDNFMVENNYTFHVLFDEMKDRQKATVTAYGVRGIPTKVVIDKEGFIRFQSSGGSADIEKVVAEMETKIELARQG